MARCNKARAYHSTQTIASIGLTTPANRRLGEGASNREPHTQAEHSDDRRAASSPSSQARGNWAPAVSASRTMRSQ